MGTTNREGKPRLTGPSYVPGSSECLTHSKPSARGKLRVNCVRNFPLNWLPDSQEPRSVFTTDMVRKSSCKTV